MRRFRTVVVPVLIGAALAAWVWYLLDGGEANAGRMARQPWPLSSLAAWAVAGGAIGGFLAFAHLRREERRKREVASVAGSLGMDLTAEPPAEAAGATSSAVAAAAAASRRLIAATIA